jgi:predicted O-methyltransferase YrrM
MSTDKTLSWFFCEETAVENDDIVAARELGEELGSDPVSPATGATLAVLAAGSRAVVEVGTGTGVGSLHLLSAMPDDGVLTTIEVEVEHHRAAKQVFADAQVRPTRVRAICGRADNVLPRLTDAAYDLVVIDADLDNHPAYAEHAIRLLRPGGVLALNHALWRDQVADPAARDDHTVAIRDLGNALARDDRLLVALLPVGDGLLLAAKR